MQRVSLSWIDLDDPQRLTGLGIDLSTHQPPDPSPGILDLRRRSKVLNGGLRSSVGILYLNTPRLAETGPTAVAAWSGVTAADLLAAGVTAAGQPWPSAQPPPSGLAPLPPGAFYLTPGEIPPDSPVDAVRSLVRKLSSR